ncbi:MAG TPA: single-stranded DNA-binding protein [Solirubrobacteraceae bacterium]|jgi:single-strand DNA-binding protein|nr:single-stranded DNA-binding protein [Solirubrobacteraceae bacterium]
MGTYAINNVVEVGRLTRDPELRSLADGNSVCKLRLAVDGMGRGGETGYIDVDAFGKSGEACAQYLVKGRQVVVRGRLQWHEWQPEVGSARQVHHIVADQVQFLGGASEEATAEAEPAEAAA